MKYSSLDPVKEKRLHFGNFYKGLDQSCNPLYIDKNSLSECKNIIYEDSLIKTRRGLYSDKSCIIKGDYSADAFFNSYTISENQFYIDGNQYYLIAEMSEMGISQYCLSIYLTDQYHNTINIGSMRYNRTSDTVFYVPDNIVFFQGKATYGCGVYAFFTIYNLAGLGDPSYEIYELNTNLSEWKRIDDYYIPTVYINGRGDKYKTAEVSDNLNIDPPKALESPNMLNGIFYAYYSSDGYSSSFTLPYSNISDSAVNCRIYYSLTAYADWNISATENSTVKEFMGSKVTMAIDRSKGIVFFTVDSGDYSVPCMSKYRVNNIRITASKCEHNEYFNIISCKCCKTFDSRIILSGGNNPNRLYSARFDNPLYFPKDSCCEIGRDKIPVTALEIQKDKILAFKQNSIYHIELKKGKAINNASLLADNDSVFYSFDSFTPLNVSRNFGCSSKSAVSTKDGNTLFAGTDGHFYCISDSFKINAISSKIKNALNEFEKENLSEAIVLNDGKYFYFLLDNIAFVCENSQELNTKNAVWYIWEFPDEIKVKGGISFEDSPILLCTKDYTTCFTAVFEGNEDILPSAEDQDTIKSIESLVTTAHFAPKGISSAIKLNRIYLYMNTSGNPLIKINGQAVQFSEDSANLQPDSLSKVTIFPEIYSANLVYLSFTSDKPLAIAEGEIYYV